MTSPAPAGNVPVIHPAVAKGILAREKSGTGGGALGHGIDIVKTHPGLPELINVGSGDVFSPVAFDPFLAEVVNHGKNDVGFFGGECCAHECENATNLEKGILNHVPVSTNSSRIPSMIEDQRCDFSEVFQTKAPMPIRMG